MPFKPIPNVYEVLPLTPLPTVIELDEFEGWVAYASALVESGMSTKDFDDTEKMDLFDF